MFAKGRLRQIRVRSIIHQKAKSRNRNVFENRLAETDAKFEVPGSEGGDSQDAMMGLREGQAEWRRHTEATGTTRSCLSGRTKTELSHESSSLGED